MRLPCLCIVDPVDDDSRDTYYLSQAVNSYYFADLDIIPWTNWLGDLYVRVRAAINSGKLPAQMIYGPEGRAQPRELGPVVDYRFNDGRLQSIAFNSPDTEVVLAELAAVAAPAAAGFGLRQIIRTLDLEQNDRIRGPMHGVFILTGGPGVGKTTVALHRIPYLINEQVPHDRRRQRVSDGDLFYSQKATLVVVWKEHLVPYLRKCLVEELKLDDFPRDNVILVDHWIDGQTRRYIPIGPGPRNYRMASEDDSIASAKLSLTEKDIEHFLIEGNDDHREAIVEISNATERVREAVTTAGGAFRFVFREREYEFSVRFIRGLFSEIREALPRGLQTSEVEDDIVSDEDAESADTSGQINISRYVAQVRRRELGRVTRYVDILRRFYRSPTAQARLADIFGAAFVEEFNATIDQQRRKREVTKADRFLLLWVIHRLTHGSDSTVPREMALPTYSHIVIDEAQYYHPLVVRLFAELALLPKGTMTIVGDVEQRVSPKGGLMSWDEMGIDVPHENINKLITNYRWSEQVFEFLREFRAAASVEELLGKPSQWYSGRGLPAEIREFETRSDEARFVAERILQLKTTPNVEKWTIAVVVPDQLASGIRETLIPELDSYAVGARWAVGEDVKESVDRVIVTNYDSIVGLEFDVVFAIGSDEVLRDLNKESIRPVWVAVTRPRQFLAVTSVGAVKVLQHPLLERFRQPRSPK